MIRTIAISLAAVLTIAGGADAKSHGHHSSYSHSRRVNEADLVSHGSYVNVSGHTVHSPSRTYSGHMPAGASAQCSDGSYSFSEHRQGTCSHHGGVASWR